MTAKSDKKSVFKQLVPEAKSLMDRTTAAARSIVEDEAKLRADKTERLRAARLQRDIGEDLPVKSPARKKRP